MEKTEKRTAEEIMYSHFQVKGKIDMIKNQFIGRGGQIAIIKAMNEYAAQELDAYKARLKEVRSQAIQDCIDIVSVTPGDENVIPKLEQLKAKP